MSDRHQALVVLAPQRGRPSSYTPEVANRIVEMVEEGHTIRDISQTEGMPPWATIRRWLDAYEDFRAQYGRAREAASYAFEAEILDAARTVTATNAAAMKVKIDTLKWAAAHRKPKVFGDSVQLKHADADGNSLPPPTLIINPVLPSGE